MDRNESYYKAVKIEDAELFKHGLETNIGNALIYGELLAIDPVSYPEIDENYMFIKKIKEKYVMKTRVVTEVDSKGKTRTKTETYYEWDVVKRESIEANKLTLLGEEFNVSQFNLSGEEYIKTIKESSSVRYKYYGVPSKIKGTIFANLSKGTISNNNIPIYANMTIAEVIESLDSDLLGIVFWIIWILLICGVVYGFYYLDNDWLNR